MPWSITGYSSDALRYLLDSTTMAWNIFGTYYGTGTYVNKVPAKRADNLPKTVLTIIDGAGMRMLRSL